MKVSGQCAVRSLPSISFRPNSTHLDRPAKKLLDSVAVILEANPDFELEAIDHYLGCDPKAGALDWDHTSTVMRTWSIEGASIRSGYGSLMVPMAVSTRSRLGWGRRIQP